MVKDYFPFCAFTGSKCRIRSIVKTNSAIY